MLATSSLAVPIQSAFRGFDTALFLGSMIEVPPFGNVDIATRIRNDNSIVAEHVHPINSVTNERRLNGSLESDSEESETNPTLALSHIAGPINISEEMMKSTTRRS